MLYSLKKFWTETPTTVLICAVFFAVLGVIWLISGGVVIWDTYLDVYISQDGGFLAFCLATTAASFVALIVGGIAIIAGAVVASVLDL